MNTKIKHRLLGILVVIGLIVILMPLFQSNKNIPSETTIIKAPPFPDQAAAANSNSLVNNTNPPVTVQNNIVQPDDTISNNRLSVASNQIAEIPKPDHLDFVKPNKEYSPQIDKEDKLAEAKDNSIKPEIAVTESEQPVAKKVIRSAKRERHHKINPAPLPNDNNGLAKLTSAVWVIQIGNFKNKTKALTLVNHLRSNGYSAFIQQVSTSFGNSTRVFVGPEYQQTAANELANRLEKQIHIRGIVLSYKPLSL